MTIVKADEHNLASVLMGKNIQFPWRGQKGVVICVPFKAWYTFIQNYRGYLSNRVPLNYGKMLESDDESVHVRYFMYEVSWALYCELACSSNMQKDATLLLPYFDDGKPVLVNEIVKRVRDMDSQLLDRYHNNLKNSTRNYYTLAGIDDISFGLVDVAHLSAWNTFVFEICMFLQSMSSNKVKTEKINIDWRE